MSGISLGVMIELELPVCVHTCEIGEPWCGVETDIQEIYLGFVLFLGLVMEYVEMTISVQQNSTEIVAM